MNGKSTAYRIIVAQLAAAVLAAGALLALSGGNAALAVLAGGAIAVLSNFYFAQHVFAGGVAPARTVLRRFYLAELIKILLTAGLFLAALVVFEAPFLPLLLGYGVALIAHWAALLLPPAPAHR